MAILFSSNIKADKAAPQLVQEPLLHQGLCYTILIVWLDPYAYIMVAGAPGIISCSSRKDQYKNVHISQVSPLSQALCQKPYKTISSYISSAI